MPIDALNMPKGYSNYNQSGWKHSSQTKDKIASKAIGRKLPLQKLGVISPSKGKTYEELYGKAKADEMKARKREFMLGRKLTPETRKKISEVCKLSGRLPPSQKGYKHTVETRKKISDAIKGDKCRFWEGGLTGKNLIIRKSVQYKLWREAVFKRDNFLCVIGGKTHGNRLQADHIKPFSLFPDLRFDLSNGRTLCIECHKKTDTYAGKATKYAKKML